MAIYCWPYTLANSAEGWQVAYSERPRSFAPAPCSGISGNLFTSRFIWQNVPVQQANRNYFRLVLLARIQHKFFSGFSWPTLSPVRLAANGNFKWQNLGIYVYVIWQLIKSQI